MRGAPTGHSVPVREVRLVGWSAGFIVAICGEIMTMPGLPKVPSAEVIRLNDEGNVEGSVLILAKAGGLQPPGGAVFRKTAPAPQEYLMPRVKGARAFLSSRPRFD